MKIGIAGLDDDGRRFANALQALGMNMVANGGGDEPTAFSWLAQGSDRTLDAASTADDHPAFRIAAETLLESASPLRSLAARRSVDRIDTRDDGFWDVIARDVHRFAEIAGAPLTWLSIAAERDEDTAELQHLGVTLVFSGGPLAQIEVVLVEDDPRNELVASIDGLRIVLDESDPDVTKLRFERPGVDEEVHRFPVRGNRSGVCTRFPGEARAAMRPHAEHAVRPDVVAAIERLREQTT